MRKLLDVTTASTREIVLRLRVYPLWIAITKICVFVYVVSFKYGRKAQTYKKYPFTDVNEYLWTGRP